MKKTASKGDKKKKKEVTEEIAKLEADLNVKHENELKGLKTQPDQKEDIVETVTNEIEQIEIKEKKVSKAQKRRDKKVEKEQQRLEDIALQEEENKNGLRHLETEKIKSLLSAKGLKIHDIPSDGDCLFAGIAHQLENNLKVQELRKLVAETLLSQKADFQPFLSLTDDQYEEYCEQMASTPKWGGQVEITALSQALKKPIEVIQAEGPPVQVGIEDFQGLKPIVLTYHRHYYGLGEHYNSVSSL